MAWEEIKGELCIRCKKNLARDREDFCSMTCQQSYEAMYPNRCDCGKLLDYYASQCSPSCPALEQNQFDGDWD